MLNGFETKVETSTGIIDYRLLKSSVTFVEKDLGATKTIEQFVARALQLYPLLMRIQQGSHLRQGLVIYCC